MTLYGFQPTSPSTFIANPSSRGVARYITAHKDADAFLLAMHNHRQAARDAIAAAQHSQAQAYNVGRHSFVLEPGELRSRGSPTRLFPAGAVGSLTRTALSSTNHLRHRTLMAATAHAQPRLASDLSPVEVELFRIDQTIPPTVAWTIEVELNDVVFPRTPRFYVQRWETLEMSWISPNCPNKGMPRPPAGLGPRACACPDSSGNHLAVYGHMESERLWTCLADWYDAKHPYRAYAPDIWHGLGPCPSAPFDSVLHRFPGYATDGSTERTWFVLTENAREGMESRVYCESEVARFAEEPWVFSLLSRRAVIIHELLSTHAVDAATTSYALGFDRLQKGDFFGACAVGAWFRDTPQDVKVIREFIRMGIPVYYRWKQSYAHLPLLADLRPRHAPAEESGRYAPPMSPRRQEQRAVAAPGSSPRAANTPVEPADPKRHWNSARSVPVQAIDAQGNPFDDGDSESPSPVESLSGVGFDVEAARVPPSNAGSLSLSDRLAIPPVNARPWTEGDAARWATATSSSRSSSQSRPSLLWHMEMPGPPTLDQYDPRSMALPARIEMFDTGADWFTVPNPAVYFQQLDAYMMDHNGVPLPGREYLQDIDWSSRAGDPSWFPEAFCDRMRQGADVPQERIEMLFRVGAAFHTLLHSTGVASDSRQSSMRSSMYEGCESEMGTYDLSITKLNNNRALRPRTPLGSGARIEGPRCSGLCIALEIFPEASKAEGLVTV
ncbi:hypothetical protein AURDEDRAFT_125914 [Auricularia subglabra TFB-10046 SS5]|nr:hypothetical protein AURDEDRAFT_125914 [Auricularia subglabra TFB-10046 SS5]